MREKRERDIKCAYVLDREREKKSNRLERDFVSVRTSYCVCESERECVCVFETVYVCVRERVCMCV